MQLEFTFLVKSNHIVVEENNDKNELVFDSRKKLDIPNYKSIIIKSIFECEKKTLYFSLFQ